MSVHLQREIAILNEQVLDLGELVKNCLQMTLHALENQDTELAKETIDYDIDIDAAEIALEEECLKIFALYQPVAIDLRYLVSVLKINNDFERIADLAVDIAKCIVKLGHKDWKETFDFTEMGKSAQYSLDLAIEALIESSTQKAFLACQEEDRLDKFNQEHEKILFQKITDQPEHLKYFLNFRSMSKCLERIGDHTKKIGEDVVYMIESKIIRHSSKFSRKTGNY